MLLTENDVITAVCSYFSANGWKIISRCSTRETGVDIVAVDSNGRRMHVEAKGATSSKSGTKRYGLGFNSSQVHSHVSSAFYTAACDVGSDIQVAIALPDSKFHKKYLSRLRNALNLLNIVVYIVTVDHEVSVWDGT